MAEVLDGELEVLAVQNSGNLLEVAVIVNEENADEAAEAIGNRNDNRRGAVKLHGGAILVHKVQIKDGNARHSRQASCGSRALDARDHGAVRSQRPGGQGNVLRVNTGGELCVRKNKLRARVAGGGSRYRLGSDIGRSARGIGGGRIGLGFIGDGGSLLRNGVGVGDMIAVLVSGLAILIVCVRKLLGAGSCPRGSYRRMAAAALLGTGAGFVLDKLYFLIGGADKNVVWYFDRFTSWEGIWKNAAFYMQGLLRLTGAGFLEQPLFSLETVGYAMRVIFLLAGVLVVAGNVVRFLRDPDAPAVDSILSVGFVLLTAAFLVTSLAQGVYSMRYMSYSAVLLAVLLIRRLRQHGVFDRSAAGGRFTVRSAAAVLATGVLLLSLRIPATSYTPQLQDTLAEALRAEGLSNGYAGFWNAPHTGVVSKGEITIRGIRYEQGKLRPYRWFSKDAWYDAPVHFVVADPVDSFSVSEQNVEAVLGPPDRALTVSKYTVMIYERDISGELAK